jgi:quinol monooxygenase YgiN
MPEDVELAMVVGRFEARTGREGELAAALARYVVLSRRRPACRNVDLVASVVHAGRIIVVEKWDSADAARAHLDDPETVAMAEAVSPLLTSPPELDLLDSISAHDLA